MLSMSSIIGHTNRRITFITSPLLKGHVDYLERNREVKESIIIVRSLTYNIHFSSSTHFPSSLVPEVDKKQTTHKTQEAKRILKQPAEPIEKKKKEGTYVLVHLFWKRKRSNFPQPIRVSNRYMSGGCYKVGWNVSEHSQWYSTGQNICIFIDFSYKTVNFCGLHDICFWINLNKIFTESQN